MSVKRKYQIIICKANKQVNLVSSFCSFESANTKFESMLEENRKKVFYPVEYLNDDEDLYEAKFEILLIKLKEEGDEPTVFRDEFGNIINCKTENYITANYLANRKPCFDEWIIINKAKWYIEEYFWVYGFSPFKDRKDCRYLIENFINPIKNANKGTFLRVVVYLNKILFDINNNLDIIICKNVQESIRLYNFLENYCKEQKIKNILWCGSVKGYYATYWVDKIQQKTNWKRHKIFRNSTRP